MPSIRDLQHYLYCPRRFALINIEREWRENFFVVRAELAHERVHSGEHAFSGKAKVVYSNVSVYNDAYDLHGVLDCVEFIKTAKDDGGSFIPFLGDNCEVRIVEYKPTAGKRGIRDEDALQLYAQKLCADSVWKCDARCYLYYADTRRRERVPFEEEETRLKFEALFRATTDGIKAVIESGKIPTAVKSAKCSGCSFYDVCAPNVGAVRFYDVLKGAT